MTRRASVTAENAGHDAASKAGVVDLSDFPTARWNRIEFSAILTGLTNEDAVLEVHMGEKKRAYLARGQFRLHNPHAGMRMLPLITQHPDSIAYDRGASRLVELARDNIAAHVWHFPVIRLNPAPDAATKLEQGYNTRENERRPSFCSTTVQYGDNSHDPLSGH